MQIFHQEFLDGTCYATPLSVALIVRRIAANPAVRNEYDEVILTVSHDLFLSSDEAFCQACRGDWKLRMSQKVLIFHIVEVTEHAALLGVFGQEFGVSQSQLCEDFVGLVPEFGPNVLL